MQSTENFNDGTSSNVQGSGLSPEIKLDDKNQDPISSLCQEFDSINLNQKEAKDDIANKLDANAKLTCNCGKVYLRRKRY